MEGVRSFLDRSRPLPLHVFIPFWCKQPELFLEEKERIQCLNIHREVKILAKGLPILERLVLSLRVDIPEDSVTNSKEFLDITRYPRLSDLIIDNAHVFLMRAFAETSSFPPLQVLSTVCGTELLVFNHSKVRDYLNFAQDGDG
jgi:hypothetical protein